jgi:hypothetical protein
MLEHEVIEKTKKWLQLVVIGLNFCPFAKSVFDKGKIHYQVSTARALEDCLRDLIDEAERLDVSSNIETSLLIFPGVLEAFDDFLDAVEIGGELMLAQGYEGVYQLASFHPEYCFADSEEDDAANYTNRSPYPMLHLIREKSIASVLDNYVKDPNLIPESNVKLARKIGLDKMQILLAESAK